MCLLVLASALRGTIVSTLVSTTTLIASYNLETENSTASFFHVPVTSFIIRETQHMDLLIMALDLCVCLELSFPCLEVNLIEEQ